MDNDDYIGSISLFGGNYAPADTMYCEGQLIAIGDFPSLFSILSDYYGGDGRSTFGLPDLRSRAPLMAGQGPGLTNRYIGQRYGSESYDVTLDATQLPTHSHGAYFNASGLNAYAGTQIVSSSITGNLSCNVFSGGNVSPSNGYPGSAGNPALTVWASTANDVMAPNPMAFPVISALPVSTAFTADQIPVSVAGAGKAAVIPDVTQIPPFNAGTYVIAVEGKYPPRS